MVPMMWFLHAIVGYVSMLITLIAMSGPLYQTQPGQLHLHMFDHDTMFTQVAPKHGSYGHSCFEL